MKKKVLNIDDNDTLNPMADVRNYGAGTEEGMHMDELNAPVDDDEDERDADPDHASLPDEIALPEELEEVDEMA